MSDSLIPLLESSGALRTGHFLLSSGLHSDRYCQCSRLFEDPALGAKVAQMLAPQLPEADVVLAPALGGILWGYELARALRLRSLFAERPTGATFALRRGFELRPGERVLLAEDVVTTGKSVRELLPLIQAAGATPVGFAAVVDRSGGTFTVTAEAPLFALVQLDFKVYDPTNCPLCRQGSQAEKPGSRAQP